MSRCLCTLIMVMAVTAGVTAADNPNTLSPKEITDGWITLFDGETTFGWKIDGDVKVESGVMILGGEKATLAKVTSIFGNFELHLECNRLEGPGEATITLDTGTDTGLGRDKAIGEIGLGPGLHQKGWLARDLQTEIDSIGGGGQVRIKSSDLTTGGVGTGTVMFTVGSGHIAIAIEVPSGTKQALRNVKVRPLGLQPIFNGRDLTGWKEIPGRKSTFSGKSWRLNPWGGPYPL